jgi:hypothetical protein
MWALQQQAAQAQAVLEQATTEDAK